MKLFKLKLSSLNTRGTTFPEECLFSMIGVSRTDSILILESHLRPQGAYLADHLLFLSNHQLEEFLVEVNTAQHGEELPISNRFEEIDL